MAIRGHDLRRKTREQSDSKLVVVWRDESGIDHSANGRALDLSDAGIRLQLPVAVPVRSYIILRAEKLGIHGQASVRYCSRRGNHYIVGVEFTAGIHRRPLPLAHPR